MIEVPANERNPFALRRLWLPLSLSGLTGRTAQFFLPHLLRFFLLNFFVSVLCAGATDSLSASAAANASFQAEALADEQPVAPIRE